MEEKRKNNSTEMFLIIVIIALVFIIGILVGTRINDKGQVQSPNEKIESKKERTDSEKEKNNRPQAKEYNKKELTEEAKGLIPYELCGAPEMPLKKREIKVEEFSDDLKGKMVISTIYNTLGYPTDTVYIEPKDYTKYFDDISFLEKLEKDKDAYYTLGAIILSYKNGKYAAETYATGCEGVYNGDELVYISSNITNNTLILTYASFYSSYEFEEDYFSYYTSKNGKLVYDKVKYDSDKQTYLSNGKEISYDEFDKYQFHFDLSNGNLRFVKMTYNRK